MGSLRLAAIVLLAVLLLLGSPVLVSTALAQSAPTYGLGRVPSAEEVRARDINISETGEELPPGRGTPKEGEKVFTLQGCIVCHTLPAGLGTDLTFPVSQWLPIPLGTNSAHHIALIQLERSDELPFKIPQLRNMFDKSGFDL